MNIVSLKREGVSMDSASACLGQRVIHDHVHDSLIRTDTGDRNSGEGELHHLALLEIQHLVRQLNTLNQSEPTDATPLQSCEQQVYTLEHILHSTTITPEQFDIVRWLSWLVTVSLQDIRSRIDTLAEERTRELRQAYDDLQRQYEILREETIRDPLTSLYNRRFLDEALEREVNRAARHQRSIGIIVLDLDHFKQFNDTYGHDMGDAVLRELGAFLQCNTRGSDIACRFGGEEFVLIFPEASLEDTRKRAEELLEGIRRLRVEYRGQMAGAITASMGVAAFPLHGSTDADLFRAADKALYRAKAAGRDRIVVAEVHPADECTTATDEQHCTYGAR